VMVIHAYSCWRVDSVMRQRRASPSEALAGTAWQLVGEPEVAPS
jgi:hypothetical protein